MNFATAHVERERERERESGRNQYAEHNRQATSRSFHKSRRGKSTGKKWRTRTLMAEHATIQPTPKKLAFACRTTQTKNVYGVPTALLKKSITKSRFTEVRSQQIADQSKRGLDDQSVFRTSTRWERESGRNTARSLIGKRRRDPFTKVDVEKPQGRSDRHVLWGQKTLLSNPHPRILPSLAELYKHTWTQSLEHCGPPQAASQVRNDLNNKELI